MPARAVRLLGLGGQGDLQVNPALLGEQWQDSDKARVTRSGELRAWPGAMRRGMKLVDASLHGAPGNAIQIMVASERYVRKTGGRLLACVDRATGTDGRVLAIGHNAAGAAGTRFVGRPAQTTGSGLDDLETRGEFSAGASAVMTVEIDATGAPDTFQWSNDGGATQEATGVAITGGWQTLENGIQIKFAATTGHTLGDLWTFCVGGRPSLAGALTRVGPHDYPWMAGAGGRVLIGHGHAAPQIDDGVKVGPAGLRAPHVKPTVASAALATTEIGRTDEDPIEWTAKAEGVSVTRKTASPAPAHGAAYIEIDPPAAYFSEVDLAYVNTSGTLGGSVKRIRFWLQHLGAPPSARNHFSLVFWSGTGATGTAKELVVRESLAGLRWHLIDLRYSESASFAFESISFRLKAGTHNPATMYLDGILDADDDDVPDSSLFSGPGGWRFAHTWFERAGRRRESAPSPFSDSIVLDGKGAELDLSGDYPGIVAGLRNTPPEGDEVAAHVYGFLEEFGTDARFGFGQFFRLTPPEGLSVATLRNNYSIQITPDAGNTGDGALSAVLINGDVPSQTITVEFTSATEFTVTGGVTPGLPGGSVGDYASTNNVLRFNVTTGGTPWAPGDLIAIVVTAAARTDGKLIVQLTDPVSRAEVTTRPLAPWMNRHLEAHAAAVADDKLIVLGDQPPYQVGQWSFTQGSHVVTPVDSGESATTPEPALWMEGRTIRRRDSRTSYRIVKALDQDGDGAPDALWIASAFEPARQEHVGPYEEATGQAPAVIEGARNEIVWTNRTAERGDDLETASPLNRLAVLPEDDFLVGLFKAGEFLFAAGKSNMAILRQDTAALADIPAGGAAFAAPRHIPGVGLLGRRCAAPLGSNAAVFLTAKCELMIATEGGQAQKHPASDRLAALLRGWGWLTDTRNLEHSFIDVIESGTERLVYIGLLAGGQDESAQGVAPGVRRRATDIWRDRSQSATTEITVDDMDFAVPWADGADNGANWIDDTPIPVAEFEAFSPRQAGYDVEISGDGTPGGGGASADFVSADGRNWLFERWFPSASGTNNDKCLCGWVASGPATALPQKTVTNARWPGSTWHAYKIGHPANGYVYMRFRSANALSASSDPANHVCDFDPAGTFGSGTSLLLADEATKLLLHVYFAGAAGRTIPAGTLQLYLQRELIAGANDRAITIDQPIVSGQWNLLELSIPAQNNAAAYTDLDGMDRDIVLFTLVKLLCLQAIPAGAYDGSGNVELYWSGGRQVRSYTSAPAEEPAEPLSFEAGYCAAAATSNDTAALGSDFEVGALVDLDTGVASLGSECRATCAGIRPSADCTPLVQAPGPNFYGDRDGYAQMMGDEKLLSWGSPSGRFVFDADEADPGDSTTFRIERDLLGQVNALGLALDDDGAGKLEGLLCAKAPANAGAAVEFRRIAGNTVDTVTIEGTWDDPPAAGDKLLVGPLAFAVTFSELRGARPIVPRLLRAIFDQAAVAIEGGWTARFVPRLRWEQLVATGTGNRVTDFAAARVKHFGAGEFEQGHGTIGFDGRASKALAYRLMCLQGDDAPASLAALAVEERG